MYNQEEGEALFEFIYAICSRKLRLTKAHERTILGLTTRQIKNKILTNYIDYYRKTFDT
jgi:hypothetical protein